MISSSSNLFIINLETSTLAGTNPNNTIIKPEIVNNNASNKNASVDFVGKKLMNNINYDGSNLNKEGPRILNNEQVKIKEEKVTEVINLLT